MYIQKHRKVIILTLTFLLVLFVLAFTLQIKFPHNISSPSLISPTLSKTPGMTINSITSTQLNADCSITIATQNGVSRITTDLNTVGVNCEKKRNIGIISPSHKYFAFEDVSGGIDSMIKVYSATHKTDVVLYVYGTSSIFDLQFLPNDSLAVLFGYPETKNEQWLNVYDISSLFTQYPKNVDSYRYFTNLEQYTTRLSLEHTEGEPRSMRINKNMLELYDKNHIRLIRSYELGSYKIVGIEYKKIKLFYQFTDPSIDICDSVAYVERDIPVSLTPIKDTIELLIQGKITPEERKKGFSTEYPHPEFTLTSIVLNNGILTLDFPSVNQFTVGGSCRVNLLRKQIELTAKQFNEVKEVRFKNEFLFQP